MKALTRAAHDRCRGLLIYCSPRCRGWKGHH